MHQIVYVYCCLALHLPSHFPQLFHPLNDAKPHFSVCLRSLVAKKKKHSLKKLPTTLNPICCITCSDPPYFSSCAQRLACWIDLTCEVKSGPSSFKGRDWISGQRNVRAVGHNHNKSIQGDKYELLMRCNDLLLFFT